MKYVSDMSKIISDAAAVMVAEAKIRDSVKVLIVEAIELGSSGRQAEALAVLDAAYELLNSTK